MGSEAAQDAALAAAGCVKVYSEKISRARSDRPQLAKLLKALDEGDTVVVTRLNRLARSTRDLLNILDAIAKAGPRSSPWRTSGPIQPRRTAA
jgi:DNA invertase Pin-like site-specific DNA recombinase